jgi:antitoxin (DNA-binding transcriptional repressor) of toxin-antitoxin stability system
MVAKEITQQQLRNGSGAIMLGLEQGETFMLTPNGVPVGELAPLRRHRFVSGEAVVAMFEGAPPVALNQLRADLDSVASQELG